MIDFGPNFALMMILRWIVIPIVLVAGVVYLIFAAKKAKAQPEKVYIGITTAVLLIFVIYFYGSSLL